MSLSELQTTKRLNLILILVVIGLFGVIIKMSYDNSYLVGTLKAELFEKDYLRKQNTMLHAAYTKLCNSGAGLTLQGGEE